MTKDEIKKNHWVTLALEGKATVSEVATALGLSTRQVKRLKKGVRERGVAAVIHGNHFKKPVSTVDPKIRDEVIALKLSPPYTEANFAHFHDLLADLPQFANLHLSYSCLYKMLKAAKIPSPKKHKKPLKHHRRKRKEKFGMMLQIDGSPHDWFGTGNTSCLHGAIDDATGSITGLFMTQNECLEGYFEIFKQTVAKFGVPASVYSDRHLIIHPSKVISIEDQLQGKLANETQFSRSMRELGINTIRAYSAQAKGRIERLWDTLQSRLVVEFALHNIKNIEDANKFLKSFIPRYNKKFAVKPESNDTAFSPLPKDMNLQHCLCVKESRMLDAGCSFSLYGNVFNVKSNALPPKAKVTILVGKSIGLVVQYKGQTFDTELVATGGTRIPYKSILEEVISKMCLYSLKETIAC